MLPLVVSLMFECMRCTIWEREEQLPVVNFHIIVMHMAKRIYVVCVLCVYVKSEMRPQRIILHGGFFFFKFLLKLENVLLDQAWCGANGLPHTWK